jgi:hypothetical protein
MTEGAICPVEAGHPTGRRQAAGGDSERHPRCALRAKPRIEDNGPSRRPISTSRIGSMSPDPSTKRSTQSSKILNEPIGHNQPAASHASRDGGQPLATAGCSRPPVRAAAFLEQADLRASMSALDPASSASPRTADLRRECVGWQGVTRSSHSPLAERGPSPIFSV